MSQENYSVPNLAKKIQTVRKRSGTVATFDRDKISKAIHGALAAVSKGDAKLADKLSGKVVEKLLHMDYGDDKVPTVENIQDLVELILIDGGYSDIAKAYIVYRHERSKLREEKMRIINSKKLDPVSTKFDVNCIKVLASRYLLRNDKNEIKETPSQMFERVAILVGIGDLLYDDYIFDKVGGHTQDVKEPKAYLAKLGNFEYKFHLGEYPLNRWHFRAIVNGYMSLAEQGKMRISFRDLLTELAKKRFEKYEKNIKQYYDIMTSQDFLPNSPTMMNAGARLGQLSACFVLGVPDSIDGIMKSARDAAMIFQSGGGVGINYSDLRQDGDIVASTSGVASGPVSFMNIINTVTEVVKQGGKRRGANMGILEVWHPDVEKFITNKTESGILENFNVSVGIWEDFWECLIDMKDPKYTLRGPRDDRPIKEISPNSLMDLIAMSAWKSAEPGLIFFDNINKYNVLAKARQGPIRATNPCGEQSLYPYESCNLGSINLGNMTKQENGKDVVDWKKYEDMIRLTTRYLDNIIDVNLYPIEEIDKASKETRRIGIGVMGVADLLYKLHIPYNSKEGFELQSKLAETLTYYSMDESIKLAQTRGEFPLYKKTEYPEGKIPVSAYYTKKKSQRWDDLISRIKENGIRNVLTTTVAPTGTLSMIADCSNGMEPAFALVYEKRVTVGRFFYTNKILERVLRENHIYTDEILEKIAANNGSLRGISEIPEDIQKIFITAMDMHWSDHLMAQSVWQDWIMNAIAKTINMPHDSTPDDVKASYLLAHELGLKGITVYRDGSRKTQVLHTSDGISENRPDAMPSKIIMEKIKSDIKNKYVKAEIYASMDKCAESIEYEKANETQKEIPDEIPNKDDNVCPTCQTPMVNAEGCSICVECGYSGCTAG